MIVYKDIFTGDELFSDNFKVEEVNDVLYKVTGKMTTEVTDVSNINIGGNVSEEAPEEEVDTSSSRSGCSIALAHRLEELGYSKAEYKTHIKEYSKKLLGALKENPDRLASFKSKAPAAAKEFIDDFSKKEFKTYWGESMDTDAMIPLLEILDDGTCYMYFWKDGIKVEKY